MGDSNIIEEWRPVVGYESHYLVSNLGEVYSFKRRGASEGIKKKSRITVKGVTYYRVKITKEGNGTSRPVHILVAEAFIGPRPEGCVVRHKDGNSLNNVASNLEYGSIADNNYDKMIHAGNDSIKHCPRGHLKVGDNLHSTDKGTTVCNGCKSCMLAQARISSARRRGVPHEPLQDIADGIYRRIMDGTYRPWARVQPTALASAA